MKLRTLVPFAAVLASSVYAQAQNLNIHTGGTKGAYYGTFGPAIDGYLRKNSFRPSILDSKGSVENIQRIAGASGSPLDVGLAQLDVYALMRKQDPNLGKTVQLVRSDIAKECLFAVIKVKDADRFPNWVAVTDVARRIQVSVAEGSGSAKTLEYLQEITPKLEDLSIKGMKDTTAAIEDVKNGGADVAFFVQFPDMKSPVFQQIAKDGMALIPVFEDQIARATVDGTSVYSVAQLQLAAGGTSVTTACTSISLVTGTKEAVTDRYGDSSVPTEAKENRRARANHADMVDVLKKARTAEFFGFFAEKDKDKIKTMQDIKELSSTEKTSWLDSIKKTAAGAKKKLGL